MCVNCKDEKHQMCVCAISDTSIFLLKLTWISFGPHISFDRFSAATEVYIPAKKVTVGCIPIEVFRLHGLLNNRNTQGCYMVNKGNYNQ